MQQTIEQQRAKQALLAIKCIAKNNENAVKYLSYVKALPAQILQNGLGQALAMEKAANDQLYQHIKSWLCDPENPNAPYPKAQDLFDAIITNDQQKYRQAQAEALAYLSWLKKFAVALLEQEQSQVSNTGT